MPTRTARTAWTGTLQDGSGQVELSSSHVGTYQVSFPKRAAENADGTTSPEELIAAAHTSCYAMQLSALIGEAGGTPQALDVQADVSLGPDPAGGFKLTGIKLTVRGEVDGLDAGAFAKAADAAKATCPVSKALTGVDITLDAALETRPGGSRRRRAGLDRRMASFADVTALQFRTADRFGADVHPEWTIAGKPNGGYLLAILARAAIEVSAHDHPIAASTHYLHAPDPGPVDLVAEVLRAGRSASQVRVRMSQGAQACVEALLTIGTVARGTTPYWAGGVPHVESTRPADAVRVPGRTPAGVRAAIMDQVDLRIDPASLGFASGRPSGLGQLTGWLTLPDGADFDPVSLLYAVDAFPPATFDIEMTGWVPTLELTVYIRSWPVPGPVRILQKAQLIEAQRFDEQCWVWDSAGRPVAHGTQLAAIRLG